MSKSKFNPLISASVMSAVCFAGISQDANAVVGIETATDDVALSAIADAGVQNFRYPEANAQGQRRYIIQFNQPSVARYNGSGNLPAIPRKANHKIDVNSSAVAQYVATLEQQQNNFLSQLSGLFGRNVTALHSYKYAVNGVAVYLSADEAKMVKNNSQVKHLELDREHFLDTDAGPTLIGANNVWDGASPSTGTAFGEGVVLGIIDSGANFDHPSFADIGGDGYDHTNPLGSGNYLGACADDPAYLTACNDKLIGGYDFVDNDAPGDAFEVLGPEDENGHGTHTASTAGGNLVLTATANGVENIEISGVARHANIVVYDACYTSAAGQGLCPNVSTLASIDQVIADGIVDVVNYSIGGGSSPWTEAVSQSFLAATDNGVFVSASAGNSGPGPATLGHVEPWTSTVGASTHTRGFETLLSITGPGTPGPEVTDIAYLTSNGPAITAPITAGIQYSEIVDPANLEACVPFPANSFDGLVALVSRGACSFEDKVNNSSDAGAIAVIVHNDDRAVAFGMNVGNTTTVPSLSIPQADGFALRDFILSDAGAQVEIINPAIINTEQADVMAGFSSRGPSPFEVNKPDVTGPGVSILAAFNDNEVPASADEEYGIISGTSMSSPHNAGAAALLKELHPNWTAPEIKSALMMTAVTAGVTKEDATTPADPFDRGAGRIQVDVASSAGLVLDESAFDFLLADPAEGGDPKTLNLASYKNDDCEALCTFERTFRSVSSDAQTYDASVSGLTGTVSPANFTVLPGQQVTLEVTIDGSASPIGDTSFGELNLVAAVPNASSPGAAIDDTTGLDDAYDGSLGTMACTDIGVSGVPFPATPALTVDFAMTHSWVGDLVVKLVNPNGDILGLMSRPDLAETADDGTGCCGSNSNLSANDPITFSDTAAVSAEAMPAGFADVNICTDDGICEYSPAPDTVVGLATLADMVVTDPNGTWQMCVGDSGGGDFGTFESVALNFAGVEVSAPPALNAPLVIIGFPDQPIIDVTPADVNETVAADESTDVTVNISNSALVADLNWTITETGTADNFTLVQESSGGNATLSGVLTTFGGEGIYPAESFAVGDGSIIENVSIQGVSNGGGNLLADATEVTVQVYADVAGTPAGHPDDGLDNALFDLTLPTNDPNLNLDGGSGFVGVDILGATGSGLELPAGNYWVLVFPTMINNNFFFWFQGEDVSPGNANRIDPGNLLGGGTDWQELVDFPGLALELSNELNCGAPWLSASLTSDATGAGSNVDVTVTLDATGLAEGVYRAAICVENDDFDNSLVTVPVTMTVTPGDLIFENGFE